jgi:hypothetical protein
LAVAVLLVTQEVVKVEPVQVPLAQVLQAQQAVAVAVETQQQQELTVVQAVE